MLKVYQCYLSHGSCVFLQGFTVLCFFSIKRRSIDMCLVDRHTYLLRVTKRGFTVLFKKTTNVKILIAIFSGTNSQYRTDQI